MAEFVIKLADERGRVQEQVQTAATAEELRARFAHAGYHVFSVRARSGFAGLSRRKVKLEPFLIFNQQFLTLIKAGLPILGSLVMLAKNQKNAHFAAQLEDVANRVKTGESLSAAFEAQTGFPVMYTTTLLAGERSGNLQEVLERYVSFQRISLTFRKKLITSLIYPCVLLVLVFALMFFMFAVVIPQFGKLYEQLGSKLPWITTDLLNFGEWLNRNLLWIGITILVVGGAFYRFASTERGKDIIDRVRIGLPVFGKIWLKYQVALFARTLSTLLTGGLSLVPSLETAARSISSRRVSKAVFSSISTVREGKSLAESLENTGVFPDLAAEMITVGEQTGALPAMLNSVSEFFEEDVAAALTAALALLSHSSSSSWASWWSLFSSHSTCPSFLWVRQAQERKPPWQMYSQFRSPQRRTNGPRPKPWRTVIAPNSLTSKTSRSSTTCSAPSPSSSCSATTSCPSSSSTTRSSSPSAIPRASWSSTKSPASSRTASSPASPPLSQITDLLKKTEQSQRVLDEASEGLTFDVLTGDENSDENISIEKLTSEEDISPIIAWSTPPSSPLSSAALPTFTSKPTTIPSSSSTASTASSRPPWRPSPASTTPPSFPASRS
jgi:type IV pilus assembly protein PilC